MADEGLSSLQLEQIAVQFLLKHLINQLSRGRLTFTHSRTRSSHLAALITQLCLHINVFKVVICNWTHADRDKIPYIVYKTQHVQAKSNTN